MAQKASGRGHCGGRLRGASSEPPGDQQSGRLGWQLREEKDGRDIQGEKGPDLVPDCSWAVGEREE